MVGIATILIALATGALYLTVRPARALLAEPGHHRPSRAACLDCHVPFVGTPSTRCLGPGCHSSLATGTPPRDGPALPVRFHVVLRKLPCGRCHTEHARAALPRDPHDGLEAELLSSACGRCHLGRDVVDHARTDDVSCGTCHGLEAWQGARAQHELVAELPCEICHRPPDQAHPSGAGCHACHAAERAWTQPEK